MEDQKNTQLQEEVCCPKFNPEPWEGKVFEWDNKLFAEADVIAFLHIPLNMGKVIPKMWSKIGQEKVDSVRVGEKDEFIMLFYDPTAFKTELYIPVKEEIAGLKNVRLSGTFLTKVFEGDFSKAKQWVNEMNAFVKEKGKKMKKLYFYYTTCPKCAKKYGKNYVVGFAQV